MIKKGQAFTFMYETRDIATGALVPSNSVTHTITVYFNPDGTSSSWKTYTLSSQAPVSITSSNSNPVKYIGTDSGLYLCEVPSTSVTINGSSYNMTDADHIVIHVSVPAVDDKTIIVPMQQFYPVSDVTVNSTQATLFSAVADVSGIAANVSTLLNRVPTTPLTAIDVATEVWTGSNTRSLSTTPPTANDIRNAVWNSTNGTRSLTVATLSSGSLATKANLDSLQSHGDTYWVGGSTGSGSESGSGAGTGTSVTVDTAALATQVERLEDYVDTLATNVGSLSTNVGRMEGYVDTLATNMGYLSTNAQTINTAATTLFIGTNSLASAIDDIPHDVWTYATYSDIANHQPVKAIADTVWGRSQNGTNRQLTSATLGAVGAGSLAKATDVAAPVIDSEDIQLTIPTAIDVATAVWNYGQTITSDIIEYRSLSTPTIIAKNGTTSLDVATVSTGSSTVDNVVWGAQTRTLSSEVLGNTKSLAVSTDIPEAPDVSDLTTIVTLLTKVLGVLCHWKEDGNNIIVYNDDNETILTIPTVKNKYGDILQMGEMPEEAS